jgi:hypothetical protein
MITPKEVNMQEDQTCPGCGMERSEWRGNGGQGHPSEEGTYCCEGCVNGNCACG